MKYMNSRYVLNILFLTGFFLLPMSSVQAEKMTKAKELKIEWAEAMATLKDYTADKRDKAIAETEAALKAIDTEIDKLQRKTNQEWQELSKEAREKREAALAQLRKQRNDVAEWYGALKNSSAGAWEEVKSGFIKSWNTLSTAFVDASEEFDMDKK